jgi:hypothetical protein
MFSCYSECTTGDWGCYWDCNNTPSASTNLGLAYEFETCYYDKCDYECGCGKVWGCVGTNGKIKTNLGRQIEVAVLLYSSNMVPLEGAMVNVCLWSDATCSAPFASGQSDQTGMAKVKYEINDKTSGFLRMEISKPGHVTATMTFSRPLSAGPAGASLAWVLPTPEELEFLASSIGVPIDPTRGHAQIHMLDCAMGGAVDLVLSVSGEDDGVTPFYVRDMRPDAAADRTDRLGWAGFFNLPPGVVNIEAAMFGQEDSPVLKKALDVRPGEMSFALLWPE